MLHEVYKVLMLCHTLSYALSLPYGAEGRWWLCCCSGPFIIPSYHRTHRVDRPSLKPLAFLSSPLHILLRASGLTMTVPSPLFHRCTISRAGVATARRGINGNVKRGYAWAGRL